MNSTVINDKPQYTSQLL